MNVCDLCKTKEMCNKVVEKDLMMLKLVPNHFKNQEICEKAVKNLFYAFSYVLDQYKTKQTCESVVLKDPEKLQFVPNQYKTQEMCVKFLIVALIYWKMSQTATRPKK